MAQHELALAATPVRTDAPAGSADVLAAAAQCGRASARSRRRCCAKIPAFSGLDRDGVIALVRSAIDDQQIDLYLQPIVTLPQRKVRYYEAMSRLNAGNGELVPAGDFLPYAEAGALMPKLDSLSVLRCVQVVRRLLLKNREDRPVLQSRRARP